MTVSVESSRFDRWRSATLAPFEHRAFALFWWASLASSFGSMIQTVGASWLMATISPSPDQVALVQTANTLPFFFLSLFAGALADTRDRRTIMLVSQVLALLASVALAAVMLAGRVTPALLLGLTFLIGCGAAAFAPAWQASIGDQVPREQIAPAVDAWAGSQREAVVSAYAATTNNPQPAKTRLNHRREQKCDTVAPPACEIRSPPRPFIVTVRMESDKRFGARFGAPLYWPEGGGQRRRVLPSEPKPTS